MKLMKTFGGEPAAGTPDDFSTDTTFSNVEHDGHDHGTHESKGELKPDGHDHVHP